MSIHTIDIGDSVRCDWCNEDYSKSDAKGGLLFQSKATCPLCMDKTEHDAKRYGEEHLIRGRCPDGMTFRDWVLSLRGGDNTIRILTGEDFNKAFGTEETK